MTTRIPLPFAQWAEPVGSRVAAPLARLVPYKTPDGYWVLLPANVISPAGYVRGAITPAGAYAVLDTTATSGMRITRAPSGAVLHY